jgi:GT2 family glycosyltransferase
MKKVVIVTVNYNTEKDTNNLLKSLEKVEKKDFELQIIIVDNGSKTEFQLDHHQKKDNITILRLNKNTGFASGYNLGIKEALKTNADYIMVINNDTKVYSDMLKNLLQVLESDAGIGVAVPKIYFAKGHEFHKDRYSPDELGKVIWYAGGYTDWDNVKSVHRGVDEVDHGQYDKVEPTDFATGCCMFFKREVLEKVGLFDERYFLYFEDADLIERIKKAGYKIYFVPTAILIHINAASSGGAGNPLQDYFITRNQMLFGMTYAPFRTKLALINQSLRLLIIGRPMQKLAVKDFYLRKFGKGSFFRNIIAKQSDRLTN